MRNLKWMLRYLIGGILMGTILLTVVYMLPTAYMTKNIEKSRQIYQVEGAYYQWAPGISNSQLDNWTDSIMIGTAINKNEDSLVKRVMLNPDASLKNAKTPVDSILAVIDKYPANKMIKNYYGRYWHGYLIVIKPLLLFFTVGDLRILNMVFQVILAAIIFLKLNQRFNSLYAFSFLGTILFLNPIVLALSFQFSTIYYILLFGMLVSLMFEKKLYVNNGWYKLFFIMGIAIAYFDLLTYPIVPLGICLILKLILNDNKHEMLQKNVREIITCSVIWGIGYLGMWGSKWILATILTENNILRNAVAEILVRTGSVTTESIQINYGILNGIIWNLKALKTRPMLFVCILLFGFFIYLKKGQKMKLKGKYYTLIAIWMVSLIPFGWYLMANNHSGIHYWFTYRNLAITVFGIFCTISYCIENSYHQKENKNSFT